MKLLNFILSKANILLLLCISSLLLHGCTNNTSPAASADLSDTYIDTWQPRLSIASEIQNETASSDQDRILLLDDIEISYDSGCQILNIFYQTPLQDTLFTVSGQPVTTLRELENLLGESHGSSWYDKEMYLIQTAYEDQINKRKLICIYDQAGTIFALQFSSLN